MRDKQGGKTGWAGLYQPKDRPGAVVPSARERPDAVALARMDICQNCRLPKGMHVNGQCGKFPQRGA